MLESLGHQSCFENSLTLSRRKMLQQMTCAAGVLAFPVHAFSAIEKTSKSSSSCTLGFSTYGIKNLATEKALRVLSGIGYDAAEIIVRTGWDADSAKLDSKRRKSIRTLINDLPLRLSSLMEHVFPKDDKQQANALERLKMAAEVAHDLVPENPPLIQTVLGGGDFEKSKRQLVDRLAEWVKIADSTETTIAIKPHRGGVVSKPSEAVWLIEQLGKPKRLRMVYDYSHYAYRDLPMEETIRTALPYTSHIAVKDAIQQDKRVVFKLPGDAGTIDFVTIIQKFYAGGYRGDINCEVSGMVSGKKDYDSIAAAKRCYKSINSAFKKANVPRG